MEPSPQTQRCPWLYWLVVALVLVALPVIFIVGKVYFDPRVEFLPPAGPGGGEWIIWHDATQEEPWRRPHFGASEFRREFDLDAVPPRLELSAWAFTDGEVRVNGESVASWGSATANWKQSFTFDLAPHLRQGHNELAITVTNTGSVPALRVAAPAWLRTSNGGNWKSNNGDPAAPFTPAISASERWLIPGALQRWSAWPWVQGLAALWIVVICGVVVWILAGPRRMRPTSGAPLPLRERVAPLSAGTGEGASREVNAPMNDEGSPLTRRLTPPPSPARGEGSLAPPHWSAEYSRPVAPVTGLIVVLLASALLNLSNAWHHQPERGPDARGHIQNVQQIARTGLPTRATDGWQGYQPPLYYYLAAGVYRLAGGQISSPLPLGGDREGGSSRC